VYEHFIVMIDIFIQAIYNYVERQWGPTDNESIDYYISGQTDT
jgi:hypothetical protein